jgi:hypothetical protein
MKNLKVLGVLAMLALSLSVFGCKNDDDNNTTPPDPFLALYGAYPSGGITVVNSGASNGSGTLVTLAAGTLTISGGTVATPKVEIITLASVGKGTVSGIVKGVVTISKAGAVIGLVIYTVSSGSYSRDLYLGVSAEANRASPANSIITSVGGTPIATPITYPDLNGGGIYND